MATSKDAFQHVWNLKIIVNKQIADLRDRLQLKLPAIQVKTMEPALNLLKPRFLREMAQNMVFAARGFMRLRQRCKPCLNLQV
jgi:hypothetical protein